MKVLSRRGAPFLFLPGNAPAARATLSLYPAQTRVARITKKVLEIGFFLRLPLPLPKLRLAVDPQAPFVRFLARQAALEPGAIPLWGMLAGNPGAPGRRFIFLVFGKDGVPRAIVKAGIGAEAVRLIDREAEALRGLPEGLAGGCRPLGYWEGEGAKALALPYLAGKAPAPEELPALAPLLNDWLAHGREQPLGSLAEWKALGEAGWGEKLERLLPCRAEAVGVRAPVVHGDLAPWNIKSSAGRWTVIDWERGGVHGVPAWDWFHYLLQTGVLVHKWDEETMEAEVFRLLESEAFQQYANAARIVGVERALLLGYLIHCTEVIRQIEGAGVIKAVQARLQEAWLQRMDG